MAKHESKVVEELQPNSDLLWKTQYYEPAIADSGERKTSFKTQSLRWEIKPVYTQNDLDEIGFDPASDLGMPGTYPFTRETKPAGYRVR